MVYCVRILYISVCIVVGSLKYIYMDSIYAYRGPFDSRGHKTRLQHCQNNRSHTSLIDSSGRKIKPIKYVVNRHLGFDGLGQNNKNGVLFNFKNHTINASALGPSPRVSGLRDETKPACQ